MRVRLAVLFLLLVVLPCAGQAQVDSSRFPDPLVVRVSDDGNTLTLQSDFAFIDNRGRRWMAPRGTVVDGASIPRLFWSIVGAPFTGRHRKASVIHDHLCNIRIMHWQRVHEVFYEGLLASGVESFTAYVFWRAVYHFGPRWDNPSCDPSSGNCQLSAASGKPVSRMPEITPEALRAFQRDIQHIKNDRLKQSVADLVNNYIVN